MGCEKTSCLYRSETGRMGGRRQELQDNGSPKRRNMSRARKPERLLVMKAKPEEGCLE